MMFTMTKRSYSGQVWDRKTQIYVQIKNNKKKGIWLLSDTLDKYKYNSLKVDLVKFNLSTIIPPYSHTDP